jgi:hypothetical protein
LSPASVYVVTDPPLAPRPSNVMVVASFNELMAEGAVTEPPQETHHATHASRTMATNGCLTTTLQKEWKCRAALVGADFTAHYTPRSTNADDGVSFVPVGRSDSSDRSLLAF